MDKLFSIGIGLHILDRLSSPLRSIQQRTETYTNSLKSLSNFCERFSRSFAVMTRTIQKASAPFEAIRGQADRLKEMGQAMTLKGSANVMLGLVPTVDAASFQKAMAEVATLTDMGIEEFQGRYGKQVIDLSVELGEDPIKVVKGLYQAISAGIDPKDAVDFMRKSGKAAIAGVSDIFTSVDLSTSIKNAFNVPVEAMGKVNDVIFQTVRKGKTTYGEIAQSFSQVAAAAGSAGISLEHVQASVAQMTLSGVKTERAYTSLKYVIDALIAPSDKAKKVFQQLGINVNAQAVRQQDLLGIMDILGRSMKGLSENTQAEAIADIFGSQEAQMFVKDFMTNTEKYRQMLRDIRNSTGTTEEAYKKMSETAAHQFDKLTSSLKAIRIALGASVLPTINAMLEAIKSALSPIAEFAQRHKTLSGVLLGGVVAVSAVVAALGALGIVAGLAIKGYTNLRIAAALMTANKMRLLTAVRAMTAAMLPNIAVMRTWIMTMARASFSGVLSGLKAVALGIRAFSLSAIAGIRAVGIAMLTTPVGWIAMAIGAAALVIYKYWAPISGFMSGLWQGLKEGLKGLEPAWDIFKKVAGLLAPVLTPLRWIYNAVVSLFKPVEDAGGAAEAMGLSWGRAIASVISWVAQLPMTVVNALGGLASSIASWVSGAGASLYTAGQHLLRQLWEGIKSMASLPVEAVASVVGRIRDLLPFSPAKEGPLADLHRIRLVETIAEGISGEPLIGRLKDILGMAAGGVMGIPSMPAPLEAVSTGYGGGQTFNISVSVTVNNAEGMDANDIGRQTAMEIEKQMRRSYR